MLNLRQEDEDCRSASSNAHSASSLFADSRIMGNMGNALSFNWNDDDSDLEDTANESDYAVDEEIVDDPRLSSICQYDTPGYVAKHTATRILKRLAQRKTGTKIE